MILNDKGVKILTGELNPKFLATVDKDGKPNVVLIISLTTPGDNKLIFGEFMIWKTKDNLLNNDKVFVLAMDTSMNVVKGRGLFKGFEKSGSNVDFINNQNLFRYNAYTGIRSAGVIEPYGEFKNFRIPISQSLVGLTTLLTKYSLTLRNKSDIYIPEAVSEKFDKLIGFKMISMVDKDGFPTIFPLLPMKLKGDILYFPICWYNRKMTSFPVNKPAAVNILTLEPVSYQLKGTYLGYKRFGVVPIGRIKVNEVYSASPPIPGKLISESKG